MREVVGDSWDYYDRGYTVVITTNGTVKSNGDLVMGRGCAAEAKARFPFIAQILGGRVKLLGNRVHHPIYRVLSFPVKHTWYEPADLDLIRKSARQLFNFQKRSEFKNIVLVRPGCGNGGLKWKVVKPAIEDILESDKFIVVNRF